MRVYKFKNGDIVEVNSVTVEFNEGLFHEVEKSEDEFGHVWIKTGRTFTMNEMNNVYK